MAGCGCGCDGKNPLDWRSRKNQVDMALALGLAGVYWISPQKSVPVAVGFVVLGYGFKKCCDQELIKPLYAVKMPWE